MLGRMRLPDLGGWLPMSEDGAEPEVVLVAAMTAEAGRCWGLELIQVCPVPF